MRFIELTTIADQTLLITPRNAGQILRFGGEDIVTSAEVPVRVMGSGVVEVSEGWWDALLIVAGEYYGRYFDGDTADTDLEEFSWTGAARDSTSRRRARTAISRPRTDEEYAVDVDPTRRFLHDVGMLSAPTSTRTWAPAGRDFRGQVLEFTLGSENPAVLGKQRKIELPPTVPFLAQDVAYNLVTRPSAEAAGTPVVIARNYSKNPSVEVDATDWSYSGSVPGNATVTAERTTELAAEGAASYRVRILADGGSPENTTGVGIYIEHAIDITGMAETRFRVSIWAAAIVAAGIATIGQMIPSVRYYDAANVLIATRGINAVEATPDQFGGHVFSGSVFPPEGSVKAVLQVYFQTTYTRSPDPSRNADVRFYSDAVVFAIQ